MILKGDFRDIAVKVPTESIDVIITSPPYKEEDGYTDHLMNHFGFLCREKLHPSGRVFFNFAQLKSDFARPFKAAQIVAKAGELTFEQTIIWVKSIAINGEQKGHYQPINSAHILNYCWEYIFVFSKGRPKPLNRLSIGVPFADKTNLTRGTRGAHGDLHCGGDIWFIPYETTGQTDKKAHKYEFPKELVRRCLLLANCTAGDTVLDPFAGSGTVGAVAESLGINCVLIDKNLLQ